MDLINKLLEVVMTAFSALLSPLSLPEEFTGFIDKAFSFLIDMLTTASWFLPLNVIVTCFLVIIAVDNFALISRIVRWIIATIRGSGA